MQGRYVCMCVSVGSTRFSFCRRDTKFKVARLAASERAIETAEGIDGGGGCTGKDVTRRDNRFAEPPLRRDLPDLRGLGLGRFLLC